MICSKCNKNTAVISINKQLPDKTFATEWLCYDCARKLGVNPLEALAKQANLSEEDLKDMASQLENMFTDMSEGMDEGDMISFKETEITETDTAETLHDRLSIIGRDLLLETLPSILNKTNNRIKQNNEEATYGFIIKREDEKIDFTKSKNEIYMIQNFFLKN